jgi:5S rRNA maturation endonuclease (ribonuclease M5)
MSSRCGWPKTIMPGCLLSLRRSSVSFLGLLPLHTERRIGKHVVEYLMRVAVVRERVTRLDVRYILPLDEHVGFADGVGLVVQFLAGHCDPDSSATAIYDYRDEDGKLVKQVVRHADVDRHRKIRQRRLGKGGGWVFNTHGLGPLLYHRELLQNASVVCVTEGEKDADAVTRLDLQSQDGKRVIGVTSGGSESWDASLAGLLKDKHVVVLPDADEPGRKYRDAMTASFDAAGIAYRVVEFGDGLGKDVSEFLADHSAEELVERIGTDWAEAPPPTTPDEEEIRL